MKKLTKLGLLAVIMLVTVMLLTGCGNNALNQGSKDEDSVEGLAVYTAEETPDYTTFDQMEGIELKYPSNYVSVGKESLPMFMDPDVLGATINIVTSAFPSAMSFEGYVDASIPGLKQQMKIDGDIKKEYINLNGRKAARLDYVAVTEGKRMNVTQILIKKDNKAYVLTLGALETDKETVSPKFEKIIKSFK
ncbi:MAG: DUF1795 domain-containing protein [Clostridia bacterium]|nr:DUF1795 domain-containing protein [Clostridia bacterium]